MGPSGRIGHILYMLDCLGQVYAGLYLGRAPRTKETLPDFLKWCRVTRPPLVFRGLTGSQRTPGFWDVTTLTFPRSQSLTIQWTVNLVHVMNDIHIPSPCQLNNTQCNFQRCIQISSHSRLLSLNSKST